MHFSLNSNIPTLRITPGNSGTNGLYTINGKMLQGKIFNKEEKNISHLGENYFAFDQSNKTSHNNNFLNMSPNAFVFASC